MQGPGLRATFASIAEELVSSALLKRMMNHAAAGDVTLGHYVAARRAAGRRYRANAQEDKEDRERLAKKAESLSSFAVQSRRTALRQARCVRGAREHPGQQRPCEASPAC